MEHIFINGKRQSYKTKWREFDRLYKLSLVEKMQGYKTKENNINESIPYKLSLNGIFYLISNYPGYLFYEELIMPLLQNYPSNVLFTLFLYPFVSRKTLLEIRDSNVFTIVYEYLKNICSKISAFRKSFIFDTDEDGYILKRLLMWPRKSEPLSTPESVPFIDDRLKNHLKKKFNWEWLDDSKVTPYYNQNFVDINNPINPDETVRLSIEEENKKAILMINDIKTDEFIVTIHDLFVSVDTKTLEKKIDRYIIHLQDECKTYKNSFLINLRSQANSSPQTYEILSKDENFVKALKDIDIPSIKIKSVDDQGLAN